MYKNKYPGFRAGNYFVLLMLIVLHIALILCVPEVSAADYINVSGFVNVDFNDKGAGAKSRFKVELSIDGRNTLTDSNGYFEIPNVPLTSIQAGYSVKISKPGFLKRTVSNIQPKGNAILGTQSLPVEIWAGDMVMDNAINMTDVVEIAKAFNSSSGSAGYVPVSDINKDGAVNMTDIMIVVKHFNKTSSSYPAVNIAYQTQQPDYTYTPTPTITPKPVVNLIRNGDFSNGPENWTLWAGEGGIASNSVVNGKNKINISNTGANPWSVHIYQGTFTLNAGKVYELSFDASSTLNRSIKPTIENSDNYDQYFFTITGLTRTTQKYTVSFKAPVSDNSARIVFSIGSIDGLISQAHDVFMDNVVLAEIDGSSITPTPTSTIKPTPDEWKLVWSDEFNGTNGSKPDPAKWVYDIGGAGWGNNELEYYTDSVKNAYQENGRLVIKAIKENIGGNSYSSARLKTQGVFETTYGRFEAKIKIPYGQGIWPAFWMLGNDIASVNWPGCGEIDIMENIGKEPATIHGTIHGPGYSAANGPTASYTGSEFSDDYHIYAVEWEVDAIRWYCDGMLYQTRTPKDIGSNKWVYNHPFFMILNVAVGGGWPGNPDATTVFPQVMQVDYVRVYQR